MEELNKLLEKHVDEGSFPGIQWQINIRDKTYYGKVGYNNIEKKTPVLDDTIYRIWSMTKPVVAVAALQLLEQDKIDIDTLITHRMSFEEFNEAVELAISGNCGKVVLEF